MKKILFPIILVIFIALTILILRCTPQYIQTFGNIVIVGLVIFTIWIHVRRRWEKYQRGEITRSQTFLRFLLDLAGVALAFASAILLGRLAGDWASAYGFWVGILVGCAVCFLGALLVAKWWGRVNG